MANAQGEIVERLNDSYFLNPLAIGPTHRVFLPTLNHPRRAGSSGSSRHGQPGAVRMPARRHQARSSAGGQLAARDREKSSRRNCSVESPEGKFRAPKRSEVCAHAFEMPGIESLRAGKATGGVAKGTRSLVIIWANTPAMKANDLPASHASPSSPTRRPTLASRFRVLTLCLPLLAACNRGQEKSAKNEAAAKANKDDDAKAKKEAAKKKKEQEKQQKREAEAKKKAKKKAEEEAAKAKALAEKPSFIPSKEFNPDLLDPTKATLTAPDVFQVEVETTKGKFMLELKRELAPKGVDRFYNLVKLGFYDNVAFFRAIDGFMVQFGIHGSPEVNAVWRGARIEDDEGKGSNTRGTISFAMGGKNTRTSQVFINFSGNQNLNSMGFSTIGEVVSGMEVVDSVYKGYGEGAPQGRGPDQGRLQFEGNDYLISAFPKLDYIKKATIVGDEAKVVAAAAEDKKPEDAAQKPEDTKPADAEKQDAAAPSEPAAEPATEPAAQPAAEQGPADRVKQAKAKQQELAKALAAAKALVRQATSDEKKAAAKLTKVTSQSDKATARVQAARKAAEAAQTASAEADKAMREAKTEADNAAAKSKQVGADAATAAAELDKAKAEIAAAEVALREAKKAGAAKSE